MRVAGIDIGSQDVKACVFDLQNGKQPQVVRMAGRSCPMLNPEHLWFEHDLNNLSRALSELIEDLPPGCDVGFTSAMHGLVLLDSKGRPMANALAWSDCRSDRQAERLGKEDPGAPTRTGTPLHSMAWPAKLLWVKEMRPEWWKRLDRILDLKTYLLERLTGSRLPLDVSSASGTGLWNQATQEWDETLCSSLELSTTKLPEVDGPRAGAEWNSRTLYLGAGDGPSGNLGTGAVKAGRIAIFLGAAGAVRTFSRKKRETPKGLFRYHLDWKSWVEGGAISNGGSVLEWLRSKRSMSAPDLFHLVEQSLPGARGVRVYPYFQGERAPFWRPGITSHVDGLETYHSFADLVRATLEGTAYCLNRILDELPPPTEPLRCTGFMFSSIIWCQLLADITGFPVALSPLTQAPALGAALLTRPDYLELAEKIDCGFVVEPDEDNHSHYRALYPIWAAGDPNPLP
jgi:gluconokinase